MAKPKTPPGLGAEGRRLWRAITDDTAGQGLELDARELSWLRSAATLADRIASMEAALAGADLVVKGVANQPVAHPLLGEIRQHRQLQAQILGRLRLDVPEVPGSTSGNCRLRSKTAQFLPVEK